MTVNLRDVLIGVGSDQLSFLSGLRVEWVVIFAFSAEDVSGDGSLHVVSAKADAVGFETRKSAVVGIAFEVGATVFGFHLKGFLDN